MDFNNKKMLITGASRGIGAATARVFASYGASIILSYYQSAEKAIELANALQNEFRVDVYPFQADVSSEADVANLFAFAQEKFSTLDVLVNNAGITIRGKIDQISAADWDRVIDVNMKSVFLCSKAALGLMNNSGSIINIGSMRAHTGSRESMHYAASKAGVLALTKCLALELAPGIRVNCVSPGYTSTDLHAAKTESQIQAIEKNIPLQRFATPEDVANVVAFLASDLAAHITGETISVSGGELMR